MYKREKELLKSYFNTEYESKTAVISLKYDDISDFLDTTVDSSDYIVKNDIFVNIEEKLKGLPPKIKADINIRIDDFGNYNRYKVLEAFNDHIEMNHYRKEHKNKIKFLQVGLLLMVGILLLFFNAYFQTSVAFSNEISGIIFKEVIDIIAWVFVWESVTIMFLSKVDLPFDSRVILLKTRNITLLDKDLNVIYKEPLLEIIEAWDNTSRIKKIANIIFLITGISLITTGFADLIKLINPSYFNEQISILALFIFTIVFDIFQLLSGLAIIGKYLGFTNKASRIIIIILNAFIFLMSLAIIFLAIYLGSFSIISSNLIIFIIMIAYLVGIILDFIYEKNQKIIDKKEKKLKEKVIETLQEKLNN